MVRPVRSRLNANANAIPAGTLKFLFSIEQTHRRNAPTVGCLEMAGVLPSSFEMTVKTGAALGKK